MQRLIVTGANGAGKSHVARRLSAARPEIPLISFDAMKLTRGWVQRPRPEIDADLAAVVERDAWILEGGPSLLFHALPGAEAVIWLDPPETTRAWRLITRPWRNLGKTRPELPAGNVDWPWQQYRFALRSLRNRSKVASYVAETLANLEGTQVWHCRTRRQIDAAVDGWRDAGEG